MGAQEMLQRKIQMKEEDKSYREYLKQQIEEEKAREEELTRLVDADVAAMWDKRIQQWKLEKEARNRLMLDVMETRRRQLKEKLEVLATEKAVLKRDREDMAKAIEEHNKLEDERIQRTKMVNKNYESDLLAQISHQHDQKNLAAQEQQLEYEDGLKTEALYQERLKQVLSSPSSHTRTHPLRRQQQPQFQIVGSKMN